MFKETQEGVVISIKVVPKSHKNEIIGLENDKLKIRITSAPEKGNANEMIIQFLAKILKLAPSKITLIYGEKSRHKRIFVCGLKLQEVADALFKNKE